MAMNEKHSSNAFDDRNVQVITRFNKEVIEQSVFAGAGVDIHQQFVKKMLNLQDQGIRDALIKLGWTPPRDVPTAAPVDVMDIPAEIVDAAEQIRLFFAEKNIKEWVIGGVQSRTP
jgi:hypothetical protein